MHEKVGHCRLHDRLVQKTNTLSLFLTMKKSSTTQIRFMSVPKR